MRADYHGGEGRKEEMKAFSSLIQVNADVAREVICQFVNSCFVIDDANGIVDDLTKRKDSSYSAMAIYMPFFFCLVACVWRELAPAD